MRSFTSRFAGFPAHTLAAAFAAGLALLASAPQVASAQTPQTITTLFNTGVNNSNGLLAGGAADPHYVMIANNIGLTNGTNALVNTNQLVGTYAQNPTHCTFRRTALTAAGSTAEITR